MILENAVVCKIGDGVGGSDSSENQMSGTYTIQECINAVKEQHPTANGASMKNPCPNKCACWAEFKMQKWDGYYSDYQSCLFSGKYLSIQFNLYQTELLFRYVFHDLT